jgi:hypothetical protein
VKLNKGKKQDYYNPHKKKFWGLFFMQKIWTKGRFQRDFSLERKEKTNEFQNKDNWK